EMNVSCAEVGRFNSSSPVAPLGDRSFTKDRANRRLGNMPHAWNFMDSLVESRELVRRSARFRSPAAPQTAMNNT
ncbi:MAG TPA: hypothetical protein DEV93_11425, partial [Chloroflexi bacterium]|nr:hypothetical protein [Chloroflexota bacterium]